MDNQILKYNKSKVDILKDYFDGNDRRSQKQNGETINWIELSEEKIEEILQIKFEYETLESLSKQNNHKLELV
jgi:hypothetical protein